ncbi:MAG: efflux RND transporter permease subunit, partial [Spirochaetota bacterium]
PGANTVDVNEEVLDRIEDLKKTRLPPSVRIEVQENQAVTVRDAIGGVGEAAVQGGLLAILVLLFFLRNMRSTFIVTTVIPVSVIATFSLIDFAGMTLNLTSLAGITLAIGMFVDNAIVVLEAIYRKALAGYPSDEAAIVGTEEVGKAITASTLTTMSVFLPMLFVEGIAGIMFEDLSLTITFSLGVSLLAALIIIPVLSAKLMKVKAATREVSPGDEREHTELSLADIDVTTRYPWLNRVLDRIQSFLSGLDAAYEEGIRWALEHSKTVVTSAIVLFGLSFASILLLGMEFLPEADEGRFRVDFETRAGATYEQTTEKAVEIEEIVRDIVDSEDIESLASRVGDGGSNLATVFVSLVDLDYRDETIWDIVNEVDSRVSREVLDIDHRLSIEGMSQLAAESSGTTSPLVVRMLGDDLTEMNEFGGRIEEVVRDIPGTRSIHSSYSEARPELQFSVRRREAAQLGLSPARIASTLRTAYEGTTVGSYSDNGDDYDIDLLLSDRHRLNRSRFEQMFFVNDAGSRIPLESVVTIEDGLGPLNIERIDRRRVVEIRGSLTGDRDLNRVMDDVRNEVAGLGELPDGIDIEYTGASEEMAEGFESLLFALLLAIGLVYMVMASQFENLVNPLIVMGSVPFAIIGLVGILLATGTTFSILTFVGAILLVGIVVNNAIVLIDYIVQLRDRGVGLRNAIVEGGKTRLKPILMTTFTTLVGLLPMATGTGTGSEIMQPMGLSVVGGLTTSALITVFLIPTLYWIVETRIRKSVQVDGSPWPNPDSSQPDSSQPGASGGQGETHHSSNRLTYRTE